MSKEAYLRDKELAAKADTGSTTSDAAATATREKELEKELETVRRFNEQNRKTIAEAKEREADLKAQLGGKDEEIKQLKKQLEASKKTEAEAKKATTEAPATKKNSPAAANSSGPSEKEMLAEILATLKKKENPDKGPFVIMPEVVNCLHLSDDPKDWKYIPKSELPLYARVPMFAGKLGERVANMRHYLNDFPKELDKWLSDEESLAYYAKEVQLAGLK